MIKVTITDNNEKREFSYWQDVRDSQFMEANGIVSPSEGKRLKALCKLEFAKMVEREVVDTKATVTNGKVVAKFVKGNFVIDNQITYRTDADVNNGSHAMAIHKWGLKEMERAEKRKAEAESFYNTFKLKQEARERLLVAKAKEQAEAEKKSQPIIDKMVQEMANKK